MTIRSINFPSAATWIMHKKIRKNTDMKPILRTTFSKNQNAVRIFGHFLVALKVAGTIIPPLFVYNRFSSLPTLPPCQENSKQTGFFPFRMLRRRVAIIPGSIPSWISSSSPHYFRQRIKIPANYLQKQIRNL